MQRTETKSSIKIRDNGKYQLPNLFQTLDRSNKETCSEVSFFPTTNLEMGGTYIFDKEAVKNVREFTHGLHIYPAKFIPQIPKWAIRMANLQPGSVILDPFCGSGTTLVEASLAGYSSFGIDINPLAQLLSKAKTTPLYTNDITKLENDLADFINKTKKSKKNFLNDKNIINSLHPNWEFWFPKNIMNELLAIKEGIKTFSPSRKLNKKQTNNIRNFYFACFSSIIKKCSYFNEREIKVRKDKNKAINDIPKPLSILEKTIKKNLLGLIEFSKEINDKKVESKVIGEKAQKINLDSSSIDLIVTSPPYLNAIDYAMAHKYSLFLLDFVLPNEFKDHCRDYIGVTERAVRKNEYQKIQLTGYENIDYFVKKFFNSKSPVDKIRSYIVGEYFNDMKRNLIECYRVLKPGSVFIIVVGDNLIRKELIPTSKYLQEIAVSRDVGFNLEGYFFHRVRNRRLKVNRNKTGGLIKDERVIVLKK